MPYLVGAVVLVGAVAVLNLLLTYGVIRRLREHTNLLSGDAGAEPTPALETGERVGPFQAVTVDGREITERSLLAGTVVAFFTPGCLPCKERLPEFAEFARQDGDRDRFLAVLVTDDGQESDGAARAYQLDTVAHLVLASRESAVTKAFGVRGYPSIVTIGPDRQVTASGTRLPVLAATV
jgi:hypothetical protein